MCVGCCCCCCCLFGWVGFWFLSLGKFVFNHKLTPVVDRPSLALVRQCRKKKRVKPLAGGPGTSLSHCRALHKNIDPNFGLFSRPRLAVDEREHGPPLGDHQYLASLIFIFVASPGELAMIHICDPSAVPSLQMVDGSVVILIVLIVLYLLPRVPRSPTASLGPRNTYTLRASRLVRLLLGAPFPVPSLSCFSL